MADSGHLTRPSPCSETSAFRIHAFLVLALASCSGILVLLLARTSRAVEKKATVPALGQPPLVSPPCSSCGRWEQNFAPDPLDSPELQLAARQIHELATTSEEWSAADVSWLSQVVEDPRRAIPDLLPEEYDRAGALAMRAVAKRLRDNVPDESWTPKAANAVSHWLDSPRPVVQYGALLIYFEAQHARVDDETLAELSAASDPLVAATARACQGIP